MESEIGKIRLYAMRIVFFLTFIGLAPGAWQEIISPNETVEAYYGVAVSFWAALSVLALIGIVYPVKMMPLLILQFSYKLVWLVGVGYPLYSQGLLDESSEGLAMANGIGVIIDLLVIPWVYAFKKYFEKPVF